MRWDRRGGSRGGRFPVKLVFAVLVAASLSACAPQDTPSESENAASAPTFVSLNPCLDAILVEVAAKDQILALSHYSRDASSSSLAPEIAAAWPSTGGTAEEVIALDPDYVLASTFIAPSTKAALEDAGLWVETFGSAATREESLDQIKRIMQLARRTRVYGLWLELNTMRKPDVTPRFSALLWQPGQIVAGEQTLVAEHLEWAGFTNHAAARGLKQADYLSLERVLADPPDLLLVAGDSAGQRHPLLEELPNTRVESFDERLLYCGGPTILRARERLVALREDMERANP